MNIHHKKLLDPLTKLVRATFVFVLVIFLAENIVIQLSKSEKTSCLESSEGESDKEGEKEKEREVEIDNIIHELEQYSMLYANSHSQFDDPRENHDRLWPDILTPPPELS